MWSKWSVNVIKQTNEDTSTCTFTSNLRCIPNLASTWPTPRTDGIPPRIFFIVRKWLSLIFCVHLKVWYCWFSLLCHYHQKIVEIFLPSRWTHPDWGLSHWNKSHLNSIKDLSTTKSFVFWCLFCLPFLFTNFFLQCNQFVYDGLFYLISILIVNILWKIIWYIFF